MFCEKCGANLPNDARFCERCGNSILLEEKSMENSNDTQEEFVLGDKTAEKESDFFDTYEFEVEADNTVDNETEIDLDMNSDDIVNENTIEENIEQEYVDQEYILPGSDTRYISVSELEGLTEYECRLARNEIYARRGRMFNDPALQAYFNSKSWYKGTIPADSFSENILNEIEKANAKTISDYEESKGY